VKCLSSAYLHSLAVCAVHMPRAACAKERATDNHKAYNCSYICNFKHIIFLAVLVNAHNSVTQKSLQTPISKAPTTLMRFRLKLHTLFFDCEQYLPSSKIRGEERKTRKRPPSGSRHRRLHVTLTVTLVSLLVLRSSQQNFWGKESLLAV